MQPSSTPKKFNLPKFAIASVSYRNTRFLSREKLAQEIGTKTHQIVVYEIRRSMPSVEVVVNFCAISGNDINNFFE